MRGGGKIIKRMEKVCSRGRMVQNMKVITWMTKNMDKEQWTMQMVKNMLENFKMV
jgi:hypothetical protein